VIVGFEGFEQFVEGLANVANGLPQGGPKDEGSLIGPLISQKQLTRVLGYLDQGRSDGVDVVTGGHRLDRKGYFVHPTVLTNVSSSSRLFQEIRERRGLVYSIYSFAAPYMDAGLFGIYAGTGEREAAELVPITIEELRKVQRDVTESELARARAQVKASLLMSLESTGSRCEQLARQLQVFGRVSPTAETVARLNAVTLDDIRRAAARVFRGRPTLAALGPVVDHAIAILTGAVTDHEPHAGAPR